MFSPAEYTIRTHGEAFARDNAEGDNARAEREHGFNLREALADALRWICLYADAVALMPGWSASKGACAERAAALALGLVVMELT